MAQPITAAVPDLSASVRFTLVRKIAEGGMGSVHEASHLLSKKTVALKILSRQVDLLQLNF